MEYYCDFAIGNPIHGAYHDREYGFPVEDESELFERLLLAIPLVSVVYSSAKQLLEAFTTGHQEAFREVVALEYPRTGSWALGFVTSVTRGTLWEEAGDDEMVQVFVPTSPNPTSGMMLILPATGVRRVDLTVEEAIKMIVSGGLVLPPSLIRRAPEPAPES